MLTRRHRPQRWSHPGIDAAVDLYELRQSLLGHRDIEIGRRKLYYYVPARPKKILCGVTWQKTQSKFVSITMSKQDDKMEVQRLVMLLNYYTLPNAGKLSSTTSLENWELEVKTSIRMITLYDWKRFSTTTNGNNKSYGRKQHDENLLIHLFIEYINANKTKNLRRKKRILLSHMFLFANVSFFFS